MLRNMNSPNPRLRMMKRMSPNPRASLRTKTPEMSKTNERREKRLANEFLKISLIIYVDIYLRRY